MRRGARDSQIVNNFFTFVSICIVVATIVLYVKYINKEPDKKSVYTPLKLSCEQESFIYYKVFNQKLLNKSVKALDKGYYRLDGGFIQAEYMQSKIKDIITLEQIDKFYKEAIKVEPKDKIEKFLKIKYEIIEKDEKNPNKKYKESKLHAGSVKTSFRIKSKEIFVVYTDFNFLYKNAIKDRINCSIKVFRNHVQSSTTK